MINVSTDFKRALANDQRDYIEKAVITLTSGAKLELSNSDIWDSGFSIEDAVSGDDNFDVGSAIINKASITINNIYDDFSRFDFDDAIVVLYVGLDLDGTEEIIKKGTFIVDEPTYNGSIIRLSCVDYMSKFDIPYSNSKLGYPATLDQIVRNACSVCDVSLNTYDFPNKNFQVPNKPNGEDTTFREVIAACAQIAGCFARCNVDGALELKWYDQASLEQQYSNLDGGYFDGGGNNYDRLSAYLNTTDGMTAIINGVRQDDTTNTIAGVDWFTYESRVASTIYVNSNSWVNLGKSPSSSGSASTGQINILRRDGQMHYLYRQEGSVGGIRFLKIRFEGYTQYSSSSATSQYANRWELFLLEDGSMVINMIQTPTLANYLGTSTLICNSQTLVLPLADGTGNAPIIGLVESGGVWSLSSTKYLSGDIADGGSFNPWTAGYTADSNSFDAQAAVHNIYSIYSMQVSTDDVVITGIRGVVKRKKLKRIDPDTGKREYEEETYTNEAGSAGYMVEISNNCLLDGDLNSHQLLNSVLSFLAPRLIGFRFRKADVTHSSDPTIEAGDVAILFDRKNRTYPFIVSKTVFSIGDSQKTNSSAKTPKKNSAARFSQETKNYIALRQQVVDEKTDRQLAIDDLTSKLNDFETNASQMYITKETDTSGALTAIIIHNKEVLKESDIVWKLTTNAFGVSTDGGDTYNLGATADGDLITRVIQTVGLNAEWITTGTLTIGGANNKRGVLKILDAYGRTVGIWNNSGLYIGNIASSIQDPNTLISTAGAIKTKSLEAVDYLKVDANRNSYIKIPFLNSGNYYTTISKTGININGSYAGINFSEQIGVISETIMQPRISMVSGSRSVRVGMAHSTSGAGSYFTPFISITSPSNTFRAEANALSLENSTRSLFYVGGSRGDTFIHGDLNVDGTKSRLVDTPDYGMRALYCYETPSPLFGDVGEGVIGDDGFCYVQIDGVFSETVTLSQYQVFLQKYGDGDCWVKERKGSYFVVEGTPNLPFGWEIKAKQADFDQLRLEKEVGDLTRVEENGMKNSANYADALIAHIDNIKQEREVLQS